MDTGVPTLPQFLLLGTVDLPSRDYSGSLETRNNLQLSPKLDIKVFARVIGCFLLGSGERPFNQEE